MNNKRFIYKESLGMTAGILGLGGIGALAGYDIANTKAVKKYYPIQKRMQEERDVILNNIKIKESEIEKLNNRLELYDNMSDKCETVECIEQVKEKMDALSELIERKEETIYDLRRKLSKIKLSDYMNENVGIALGISFAAIAASIVGGYIKGMSDSENIARLAELKNEAINKIKKEYSIKSNGLRESIKQYKTSIKRCTDHRCIEDFNGRIKDAIEDIMESKQIMLNSINQLTEEYRKKAQEYKSLYNIDIDL